MALRDIFKRTQKPPPKRAEQPVGRSGTVNTQGFISDAETNANLIWPRSIEVYTDMRRTDPSIKWILALLKYPILASEQQVEAPKNPTPEEQEAAKFVEHALFEELDGGFSPFLRHMLTAFDYGHAVAERSADYRPVEFTYEDDEGTEHTVSREAFVLARLSPRLARTIQRWVPNEKDRSKLAFIEQWLSDGDPGEPNPQIPAERLVVFTHDQEGDDWRGQSILRPAYRDWRYKLELENLEAIAIERSTGVPIAYLPNASDTEQDAVETGLQALRQSESTYLLLPKAKWSPQNPEGWLIDTLQVQGSAGQGDMADKAIARHEAAMARNVMAEFMRLGHEETGARATADVQQDPYWKALEAEVGFLEQAINEQVIAPLVEWNYEGVRPPHFSFAKLQAKNVQIVFEALQKAVTAGFVLPDTALEKWARDLLDAPEPAREDVTDDEGKPVDPHAKALEQKLNPPTPEVLDEEGNPVPPKKLPPGAKPAPGAPPPTERKQKMTDRAGVVMSMIRELRPEERCLALSEIVQELDSAEEQIIQAAERVGPSLIAELQRAADAAVEHRSPEAAAALSVDHTSLADALEPILDRLYEEGRRQVAAEIAHQQGHAFTEPPPRTERLKRLRALAVSTAESIAAAATRALRQATLRRIETPDQPPTGPGYEPLQTLVAEAKRAARPVSSTVFGTGRSDAILESEDVAYVVYSAILDGRECYFCQEADGREGQPDELPAIPNPDCYGGGACRCMHVPVVSARPGLAPQIGPGYVVD